MKRNFYENLELSNLKKQIRDGNCNNCGMCCANILFATDEEINSIKKFIKENNIEIKSPYSIMDSSYKEICPFLDENKRCRIYPVRLSVCRSFSCDEKKHVDMDYRGTKIIDMLETFGEGVYYPCKPNLENMNKEWKEKVKKAYV